LFFFCLDRPASIVSKCNRCENADAEYWCNSDCKRSFCGRCWNNIHEVGQYRNHTKMPAEDRPPEMPTCKDHTPEDQQMTVQNNGLLECPNHDGVKVEEAAIDRLPPNKVLCDLVQLIGKSH